MKKGKVKIKPGIIVDMPDYDDDAFLLEEENLTNHHNKDKIQRKLNKWSKRELNKIVAYRSIKL